MRAVLRETLPGTWLIPVQGAELVVAEVEGCVDEAAASSATARATRSSRPPAGRHRRHQAARAEADPATSVVAAASRYMATDRSS